MIIDGVHIPVTRLWLEDVLKLRVEQQGLKIADLFLVTRCVGQDLEGDSELETKYGKIKVFFRSDLPDDKLALVLHRSKFNYPQKNVRLDLNIAGGGGKVTTEAEGRDKNYVN